MCSPRPAPRSPACTPPAARQLADKVLTQNSLEDGTLGSGIRAPQLSAMPLAAGSHCRGHRAEGRADQEAALGDLLAGQSILDHFAWVSCCSPCVVEDGHVGRMRLQPVPPLLLDGADMMSFEHFRDHADLFAAVDPHHEVMSRPEDFVCPVSARSPSSHPDSSAVSRRAASATSSPNSTLPPGSSQNPVYGRAPPDERHCLSRPGNNHQRGCHYPTCGFRHQLPQDFAPGTRQLDAAPSLDPLARPALAKSRPHRYLYSAAREAREHAPGHRAGPPRRDPPRSSAGRCHVRPSLPVPTDGVQDAANTTIVSVRLVFSARNRREILTTSEFVKNSQSTMPPASERMFMCMDSHIPIISVDIPIRRWRRIT
jgi:hypothetical protein